MEGLAEPWPGRTPGAVAMHAKGRLPLDVVSELLAILAEEPLVVLCDLSGIAPAGLALVEDFAQVGDYLREWPANVVVAYSPDERVRGQLLGADLGGRVLIRQSRMLGLADAVRLVADVQRAKTYLAPVPGAAHDAREFVATTLQDWRLAHLVDQCALVATELVTNAVAHAGTVLDLAVSHAGYRVRIAVRDRGGGRLSHASSDMSEVALEGRGLLLVQAYARAWGVLPGRHTGKTVWAVLDDKPVTVKGS